jgi:serine/threonine protein kinase
MDKKEWSIDGRIGNIKDSYHFIEKIASGGFGIVYLAEHRATGNYLFPPLVPASIKSANHA